MPTTPQLDYATRPSLGRRIKARAGVLCVTTVLIVVILAGYRWGPYYWGKVKLLRRQRLCMQYTPPAGQMVYEEWPGAMVLVPPDAEFAEYTWKLDSRKALLWKPKGWGALEGSPKQSGVRLLFSTPNGIAFLHGRRSPAGHERLVAVLISTQGEEVMLGGMAVIPGTWSEKPVWQADKLRWLRLSQDVERERLRITAGRADPADASHFTIDVRYGTRAGTIDGWLADDDTVALKPRQGWADPLDNRDPSIDEWHLSGYATNFHDRSDPDMTLAPPDRRWDALGFKDIGLPVMCGVAFSPDGSLIAATNAHRVEVWRVNDAVHRQTFEATDTDLLLNLAFSRDGRYLAAAGLWPVKPGKIFGVRPALQGRVLVWDRATGKVTHVLEHWRAAVTNPAFSEDGREVSNLGVDGFETRSDLATDRRLADLSALLQPGDKFLIISYPPDQRVAFLSRYHAVRFWGGSGPYEQMGTATFGPGGIALVTDTLVGVSLFDVSTGKRLWNRKLPKGGQRPNWGQISPTGASLAVAIWPAVNGAAYVWNLPNADTVWRLNSPPGNNITGLAYSPDGKLLAVANPPGPVLIWKLDDSLVKPDSPTTNPVGR